MIHFQWNRAKPVVARWRHDLIWTYWPSKKAIPPPGAAGRGCLIRVKSGKGYVLLDFPLSPSPTFIGLRQTPQTPRLDLRGIPPAGLRLGRGPYTAEKQALVEYKSAYTLIILALALGISPHVKHGRILVQHVVFHQEDGMKMKEALDILGIRPRLRPDRESSSVAC